MSIATVLSPVTVKSQAVRWVVLVIRNQGRAQQCGHLHRSRVAAAQCSKRLAYAEARAS